MKAKQQTQTLYKYLNSEGLFETIAHEEWAVFLDSGVAGTKTKSKKIAKNARYDLIACRPQTTLVTIGAETTVVKNSKTKVSPDDPIDLLKKELPNCDSCDEHYTTGALGYFSYDLGRRFEGLPSIALNDEALPEMAIGIYSVVVVIDHKKGVTKLISFGNDADTKKLESFWQSKIEEQFAMLDSKKTKAKPFNGRLAAVNKSQVQESMSEASYKKCFQKVRDYIVEGDCYQVNLAKQFSIKAMGDAWQTYRYLRKLSPAPYGAYLNFPFAQVLSNSPESFIRIHDKDVVTSPIKGTIARDHTDFENDKRLAKKLHNSKKDRAENLMIVDLMRNDLSRCCELDSVKVPKLFEVHSFANVHHLISKIIGKLKKEYHSLDLLKSCFPGGSITGAPKIRSMQIIEELEPQRRGLYCGAIGYVGIDGSLETNIAIRTIVFKDGVARFSAGGGLVLDSKANIEYQEVIDKASMMRSALLDD